MTVYARLIGSAVAELIDVPDGGASVSDLYHPDIVAALVPVPTGVTVEQGYLWDGEAFAAPPAPAAPVPESVTKLQLVRALRQTEHKAAFDAALNVAPADTQEDWSLAVEIRRDDPLVASFASELDVSSADVDDLFRLAATL